MSADTLPLLPTVDGGLLATHQSTRARLAERIRELPDRLGDLFRWHARHRLTEAAANLFVDDRPLVFPPRRRHLGRALSGRLDGCGVAVRHLDSRLEMCRRGHLADVIGFETPYVLNALAESRDPGMAETNPGLVRMTTTGFDATQTAFRPPDGARCADLLQGACRVANDAPVPPIVRAGWLCATVLAVHPFVDGNGRAARLLYQLVASSDPITGFDWGALEQWAIDRPAYVEALKASQAPSIPDYDGDRIDTTPFVDHALRSAVGGAELVGRRVDWFERASELLDDVPIDARVVEIAAVAAGSSTLAELSDLVADPACTEIVGRLVAADRLTWDRRGLLTASGTNPLLTLPA